MAAGKPNWGPVPGEREAKGRRGGLRKVPESRWGIKHRRPRALKLQANLRCFVGPPSMLFKSFSPDVPGASGGGDREWRALGGPGPQPLPPGPPAARGASAAPAALTQTPNLVHRSAPSLPTVSLNVGHLGTCPRPLIVVILHRHCWARGRRGLQARRLQGPPALESSCCRRPRTPSCSASHPILLPRRRAPLKPG